MDIKIKLPSIKDLPKPRLIREKGSYGMIDLYDNDISSEVCSVYNEAKKLVPFDEYRNPYWDFLLLSDNFFFGLGQYKKTHTDKYAQELYSIIFKFIDNIFFVRKIGNFSLSYYITFKQYFKQPRKNKKSLFISNILYSSLLEEYLFYNEFNNNFSHTEKITNLFLKNHHYQQSENIEEDIKIFKKEKKEIKLIEYHYSVCDIVSLLNINMENKYDDIFINASVYIWSNKENTSFINAHSRFNLILLAISKLKKNGRLFFYLTKLDSQLVCDLIALLQFYFEEIEIIKPATTRVISDFKLIACSKFKGINDIKKYQDLITLSQEWHGTESSCGLDIKEGPSKDKEYVTKIFNYKNNLQFIKDFIVQEDIVKLETFRKMIDNYHYVKNGGGERAEKNLILKIFRRSLDFLKKNNIPLKIKYTNFNKELLDVEFNQNFSDYIRNFNKTDSKITMKKKDYNFKDLDYIENRLKIYKRRQDYMDDKRHYDISKIFLKPYHNLKNIIGKKLGIKISQGFIKMYEILNLFNILPSKRHIKTFHACEAPGQFIMACKYYLKKNNPNISWDWNAQSLSPSFTSALKDDYKLMERNPDKWDFAPDHSGDITKIENIKYYAKYLKEVDLVTFDCGENYSDYFKATYQDKISIDLNIASILMILNGLKKSSNFVIKVFLPQNSKFIISLNYLLYKSFENLHIYKPLQNPNSSEIYLIGKNYRPLEDKIINKLFDYYQKNDYDSFLFDFEKKFISDYESNMVHFTQKNINALTSLIYYDESYDTFKKNNSYVRELQNKNISMWLKKFKI